MFPFNQSGEPPFQQDQHPLLHGNELLAAVHRYTTGAATAPPETSPSTTGGRGKGQARRGRGRKSNEKRHTGSGGGGGGGFPAGDDDGGDRRKTMHREVERKRREEMAGLFSTLRSVLPLEYVQGRRSTSDQIGESINYIKHMQGRIKELEEKRGQLRTLKQRPNEEGSSSMSSAVSQNVNVEMCNDGRIEIRIRSGRGGEGFNISRAIKVLHELGLEVVSSISSRLNEGFLHNIQCQTFSRKVEQVFFGLDKPLLFSEKSTKPSGGLIVRGIGVMCDTLRMQVIEGACSDIDVQLIQETLYDVT